MTIAWLMRLYPRVWRDRYGEEFIATLSAQRTTPLLVLDIILGAVDAHLHPQISARAFAGDRSMTNLQRRCSFTTAAAGPRDHFVASGVTIGCLVVFTVLWLACKQSFRETAWVEALGVMLFPVALVLGLPFAYTKGWPAITQAVFVGGALGVLGVLALILTRTGLI